VFDAVIDFDAVVRDPADVRRLAPEFDSGDHLHPSDAGYRAMAEAIDLRVLR
jgi:lysophospholipase L1-like esterase